MVPFTRNRQKAYDAEKFAAKKRHHFFKIIHSSIIQDRQLRIPRNFVGKFGQELSDIAVLEVPNGNVWHVRLRKTNNEVWLERGWEEFVEYHSICVGHFLVFRYDGKSHFLVLIFDTSGNEIDYLSTSDNFEEPSRDGRCLVHKKKDIEEDPVEILDVTDDMDSLKELATTVVDPIVQCDGNKPIKSIANAVEPSCLEWESTSGVFSFHQGNQGNEPNAQDLSEKQSMDVPERHLDSGAFVMCVSTQDKDRAIQAAREFKSENPFFMVIMRRTYVKGKFALNVPFQFMKQYFKKNPDNVTLRSSDGRTWPALCFFYQGIAKIYSGWAAFVKENNVEEGDVCVFELITNKDLALKVSIFSSRQS